MKTLFVSHNGQAINSRDADKYLDSFLSDEEGIYEALPSYYGKLFRLQDHLNRLEDSAKRKKLKLPFSIVKISQWCEEAAVNSKHDEQFLIIQVKKDSVVIISKRIDLEKRIYEEGMNLKTVAVERPSPRAKTLEARFITAKALIKAKKDGYDEIILVDHKDKCREGSYSNLFWFKGDRLYTNTNHALPGITQSIVMELLNSQHKIVRGSLPREEISQQEEIFITSSRVGVAPVRSIDKKKIGNASPGKRTKNIINLYFALTKKECQT